MGNIFVVGACTAGKGRPEVSKVASFVGKIFVVSPPTTKTTNILPHENYTLYGSKPGSKPRSIKTILRCVILGFVCGV